jgi:hypothetical protein
MSLPPYILELEPQFLREIQNYGFFLIVTGVLLQAEHCHVLREDSLQPARSVREPHHICLLVAHAGRVGKKPVFLFLKNQRSGFYGFFLVFLGVFWVVLPRR